MLPATEPPTTPRKRGSDLALVQGMADTKATLAAWRAHPWGVLGTWFAASFLVATGLLVSVGLVAHWTVADPGNGALPGIVTNVNAADVVHTVARNLLVLALHSLACVAGFIAGSSLPLEAEGKHGVWRAVHDYAGRFAILFVSAATAFSLLTQAYVLGGITSDVAARLDLHQTTLIVLLLPHALPELVGLFLPLAAWLIASRRGQWNTLLAATVVTTAIALPMVLVAAMIEVYVSPGIIAHYAGLR